MRRFGLAAFVLTLAIAALAQDRHRGRADHLIDHTRESTGIDVPTANTILINQADRLGLAFAHRVTGYGELQRGLHAVADLVPVWRS